MNKTLLRELVCQYEMHSDAREVVTDILKSGTTNFIQYLPPSQKCTWTYRPERHGVCDYWETGCESVFQVGSGTPVENGIVFCPYCGRRLEVNSE